MSIQIHRGCGWKLPFHADEIERLVQVMLLAAVSNGVDASIAAQGAVDIAVLDDLAMERLHREALACSGPTNILSFPAPAKGVSLPDSKDGASDKPRHLGSLALSVDTLARECFLYGQTPREHCIRLLAHGIAHLLGFDHGAAMWELTDCMEKAAGDLC